jgi:transmembrane sensor
VSGVAHSERLAAAAEAAASWYSRISLGSPTAQERRAFDEWLAADAAHARAYEEYDVLWRSLGPLDGDPRVSAARSEVRSIASARGLRSARWRGASIAASVTLAASVLVAVALGAFSGSDPKARLPAWLGGPQSFSTAVGQHSTVALEDGSEVVLNTDSEITPAYTRVERAVRMKRGQALFSVARNASRPFVVYAGDRRIVALGTSFDVRLEGASVQVTLLEGRVTVDTIAAQQSSAPVELAPRQQLVTESGARPEVRDADLTAVTSWREGRLVFSDEPLADAVAEVNRYSRTKIVLADPALAALRISGVFRTGQTAGFVAALETRFPLQIRETDASQIVLAQR